MRKFMKRISNFSLKTTINLCVVLTLVLFVGLGCGIVKNPFRDYSHKPFNSQEWRAGDTVERGRMIKDLYGSRDLDGESRESVVEMLGEPDKKSEVEAREVWLYRIYIPQSPMKYFPVSFEGRKAFGGRDKGGTRSMVVEE